MCGGNPLTTFRDKLSVPSSRVNKSKVSCIAYYPKRQRISSTSWRKPENRGNDKSLDKLRGEERRGEESDTGERMEERYRYVKEKKMDKTGGGDEDNMEKFQKVAVTCVSDVLKPRKPPPG